MKRTLMVLLVVAGMVSASWAQTIINTDFTAGDLYSDGDLAGQNSWAHLPNTDTNAFDIADSAGVGFADMTTTSDSISTNGIGQFVYLNTASAGNNVDDEWAGVMDFKVDVGNLNGGVLPSRRFFDIGLTANATNFLNNSNPDDVFVSLRLTGGGGLQVKFNGDNSLELAVLGRVDMGWDPENEDLLGEDHVTDDLRLEWTVRKNSNDDTYSAWASITNLVSGSNVVAGVVMSDSSRGAVWSNAAPVFAMGRPGNVRFNDALGSNWINTVVDNLGIVKSSVPATPVAPVVSLAGGDQKLTLDWTTVPDADSYIIERSLESTFGFTTITTLTSTATSFLDTGLVNNQTYYYKVTADFGAAGSAISAEVVGTPVAVVTGNIFNEDFTTTEGYVSGDLDGQTNWFAISGTGTNAFAVDPAGNGFIDTAPFSNDFDTVNGNALVWGKGMSNNVNATWSGHVDFQITAELFPGAFKTNNVLVYDGTGTNVIGTNVVVKQVAVMSGSSQKHIAFDIGITDNQSDPLFGDGALNEGSVTIELALRGQSIRAQLNSTGNNRALFTNYTTDEAGWDPEWNSMTNDVADGPDFITDMLRLTYTIQKENVDGLYLATATLSNLVSGAVSQDDPLNDKVRVVHEWADATAYAAPVMQFGLGKSDLADRDGTPPLMSMLQTKIDSISLVHDLNAAPILFAPQWAAVDPVIVGDAQLSLAWTKLTENTTGYKVYRSVVDGGPYTEVAEITNSTTIAYTDTGLNNIWTYYYVLTTLNSVGITNESAISVQQSGMPAPKEDTLIMGGGPATWSSDTSGTATIDNGQPGNLVDVGDGSFGYIDFTSTPMLDPGVSLSGNYNENKLYGLLQFGLNANYRRGRVLEKNNPQTLRFEQFGSASSNCAVFCYVLAADLDVAPAGGTLDMTAAPYTFSQNFNNFNDSTLATTNAFAKMALRQGGVWYVSEQNQNGALFELDDVGNATNKWAVLTVSPTTMLSVDGLTYATIGGAGLNAVDAVGWVHFNANNNNMSKVSLTSLNLSSVTSYQFWEAENLILPPSAGLDPDGDGRINLWEFGLGGDPNDIGSLGVDPVSELVNVGGTNYIQYVHLRRKGALLGIDYKLKDTVNLVFIPMTNDAAVASQSVGEYDANYETVTNLIPTTESAKFIRLQLEKL